MLISKTAQRLSCIELELSLGQNQNITSTMGRKMPRSIQKEKRGDELIARDMSRKRLFPVEVGCRGFPAQSVWRMFQALCVPVGKLRKTSVRRLGEETEKASRWLWNHRQEQMWKP